MSISHGLSGSYPTVSERYPRPNAEEVFGPMGANEQVVFPWNPHPPPAAVSEDPFGFDQWTATTITRPPLDCERARPDNGSTANHFALTDARWAPMAHTLPGAKGGHGNPVRDCAYATYLRQIAATAHTWPQNLAMSVKVADRYRFNRGCVHTSFFNAHQNPPLARTAAASEQIMRCLIEANVLQADSRRPDWAWVRRYLAPDELEKLTRAHHIPVADLAPRFFRFGAICLNAVRDIFLYEFFELRTIYNFAVHDAHHMGLPSHVAETNTTVAALLAAPTITPHGPKTRLSTGNNATSLKAIAERENAVATRQREVTQQIIAYEQIEVRANAINWRHPLDVSRKAF